LTKPPKCGLQKRLRLKFGLKTSLFGRIKNKPGSANKSGSLCFTLFRIGVRILSQTVKEPFLLGKAKKFIVRVYADGEWGTVALIKS
jgi:hypothetical protein